ncbi:MAG: hypothetical protein PVF23_02345 [Chromatiales bacterium]|jgi:cell fate (sporulation/competence/biofilm development) regulator YlbF (YheA/YmcA/DUF963 family)
MATKKSSKPSRSPLNEKLRETASEIYDEMDEASERMIHELRTGLESISDSMSNAAKVAQETSRSVGHKVRDIDSRDVLLKLMDEVEEISTGLMEGVGKQFRELRERIEESATAGQEDKTPVKKKSAKKKAVRRKTASKKKKAIRKKS